MAREGAVQGGLAHDGSSDDVDGFAQLFIGGWGGSSSGECEEWPFANNTDGSNSTMSTEHCQQGGAGTAADSACPVFKGFLSADVPSQVADTQRRYVAHCRPMAEVWQLGLVEVQ